MRSSKDAEGQKVLVCSDLATGPREKEHNSTVNMEPPKVEHACDDLAEQATAPKHQNRNDTDNKELQIEDSQENALDCGVCLARIVYITRTSSTPAQQLEATPCNDVSAQEPRRSRRRSLTYGN